MADSGVRTLAAGGRAAFVERNSRFIGHVSGVHRREEVSTTVESIADDHPDATHVVSAYRLATDPVTEGSDDAGEPGGSAGPPVLGVLRSTELVDVVAVVVRYYGGTNLGYGGLVRAYARATTVAIEAAELTAYRPQAHLEFEADYETAGTIRRLLESEGVDFEAEYAEAVAFRVTVEEDREPHLRERLRSATHGQVTFR